LTYLFNKDKIARLLPNWTEEDTLPLFYFTRYPYGTLNNEWNSNAMAVVENIKAYRGVKTGCDYFNVNKKLYNISSVNLEFVSKCRKVDVNGQKFDMQIGQCKHSIIPVINQTYYVKVMKQGYILGFAFSYIDREGKALLDNIMRTVKFSKK
jgi:hypothetical protein